LALARQIVHEIGLHALGIDDSDEQEDYLYFLEGECTGTDDSPVTAVQPLDHVTLILASDLLGPTAPEGSGEAIAQEEVSVTSRPHTALEVSQQQSDTVRILTASALYLMRGTPSVGWQSWVHSTECQTLQA
jgi:hypothetical protein